MLLQEASAFVFLIHAQSFLFNSPYQRVVNSILTNSIFPFLVSVNPLLLLVFYLFNGHNFTKKLLQ